ncbi:methyltransferase [Agarivorans aestuarii]|uniref:Methyltransferase n=1 Tax=Agarivorans aestuarii TaxID=1563703 RepID=A0ABU7G8G9_9ALTE|nr:methyltransferase [Agarivorans aestuarii]MEE1675682.1 methyltransferase [Agarivorans aestuarii]
MFNQSLEAIFHQHDQLLQGYQQYWQFSPFQQHALPWDNKPLLARLQALSPQDIEAFEQQPEQAVLHFSEHFPELSTCLAEWQLAPNHAAKMKTPFWLTNGIKGRKAEQIQAFSEQLQGENLAVLEWCAGKGHLGRLISFHHQLPVTSLEWQATLCDSGEQQAKQLNLPQQFHHCDVLEPQAQRYLQSQQHAVALHACGELHLQLLHLAAQHKPQKLSICPCCYHLINDTHYSPLSDIAQQTKLRLSKADLRLAVAQSVTSGQRVQTLRQRELHWRLSYQCLREELTQHSHYQALPSIAKQWFSKDAKFKDFVEWACQQHKIIAPTELDEQRYLEKGQQRHLLVRRLELVQQLFRPIMERWLLLDRCLFLQQQGYQVGLVELFPFKTSPRNVLIQAQLG